MTQTVLVRACLISLSTCLCPLFAGEAGVRWVLTEPSPMVTHSHGFEARVETGAWAGKITDASDPHTMIAMAPLDASREKHLLLDVDVSARMGMQVFFAEKDRAFGEANSFRIVRRLRPGRHVYAIDLSKLSAWRGTIRDLRLDPEQAKAGDEVRLYRVGVSEAAPTEQTLADKLAGAQNLVQVSPRLPPQPGEPVRMERLAAWHKTVAVTDETVPNSGVFTYTTKSFSYTENNWLVRFLPSVQVGTEWLGPDAAEALRVEDTPGGVVATFRLGTVAVRTEITPLFVGRCSKTVEGSAAYSINTEPPSPVRIAIGNGKSLTLIGGSDAAGLRELEVPPIAAAFDASGKTVKFTSGLEQIPVALAGTGQFKIAADRLTAECAGSGRWVMAFAENGDRAVELARLDADIAIRQVSDYYTHLWSTNHIETPEPVLDDAFRHALRTLEYTWIAPYGWVECIHHWYALWHMQATAGAEWIGQADRSRTCTLTHAALLTDEGAVPQLSPAGHVHRDFGGSNQYWAWQVRHYVQFTGERDFAQKVVVPFDRVLDQTSHEYDKDDNLLLAWGLQIGNQEDYVATPYDGTTPSIELINMLKTRAELARALGDEATAAVCEARTARTTSLLRERLWMPDLGRFAFFVDPHGNRRLDGQYHTFTYPAIWGIADSLDTYTTLRQVTDQLTGPHDEVYCSNNFPNHVGGTWGMQAGAAQQPWAAWAYSAAGQFERTYLPLKAAATWAMDANHRGAWPEVALEPTPAYFSPPAGLFVAATVEALFGLKVDVPAGVLNISPSFPSTWPAAKLQLADFNAEFKRGENRVEYTVSSKRPQRRQIRGTLPPARVARVLIDGKEAAFTIEPGVNSVVVETQAPAATCTGLLIEYSPITYVVRKPLSVAQGDSVHVEFDGVGIQQLDDRCGVLANSRPVGPAHFVGDMRSDLLQRYLGYHRLGQLTLSRRTFFLKVGPDKSLAFWTPVDLTILPRFEVATGRARNGAGTPDAAGNLPMTMTIRNNTSAPLRGSAHLSIARGDFACEINVAGHSEQDATFTIAAEHVGLLSPGDNRATLVLPGEAGSFEIMVPVDQAFVPAEPLAKAAKAGLVHVPLDEGAMIPDTQWTTLRVCPAYPHMPWNGSRPPLEALAGQKTIECPGLPLVDFALPQRKFIPVSFKGGRPSYVLDLKSQICRKLYLLVVPFLDNHDMFSEVGRVTVRSSEEVVYARTLRFPGDLDWWFPPAVVREFATVSEGHPNRFGLLPLLTPDQADWAEGHPPKLPQPKYWSSSRLITTASSVMNIIEIDLGRALPLASLTLEALGVDPSFGIVAVTALTPDGEQHLRGTPWMPPTRFREPRTVFSFEHSTSLDGWRIEGKAFSVGTFFTLFMTQTLNSLGAAGEAATGKAVSPDFELKEGDATLMIQYHGGHSKSAPTPQLLAIDLVDARSGERLQRMEINADHTLRWGRIPVGRWSGRSVHLELTDENKDSAYAWLGLANVKLAGQ